MEKNHIIIGLGGRGGDTLKAFKKVLYKNSLTKDVADSYPIQYLYVDSSSEDLKNGWDDELGVNYGIDDWAKINTRAGVEWKDIFENLGNYPTIRPWLGDKSHWATMSLNTELGSGQLRKLGRAYFAASVFNKKDNSFVKNLEAAWDKVCKISKSASKTHYHILVGLSGGTGSGTILDIISLISKHIAKNNLKEDKIIIYALLPERNVKKEKDILGFYYPNAYAALKEINAIGLHSETETNPLYYQPIDIEEYQHNKEVRIEANYTTCFIFSNENEKSRIIDYEKALPNMIADFLYHTLVTLPDSNEGQNAYVKLTENSVIVSETDKFTGKKERAVKFASASIKRIEIPEIEVIDLYGAKTLQQFLYQQKYNNWIDGKGYHNKEGEDKTTDFVENRSRPDNFLQLCNITLDQLSLKTPHDGTDFKNSDDEWDTISERLAQNALIVYDSGKDKKPIQYFKNYMDGFFSTQFRGNGMGVEKYWSEKNRDIEQQSDYFYQKIESHLIDLWVKKSDRSVGLNEILTILERLKNEIKTISTRAANRIAHLTDPNKFDVKDADYTNAGCNQEINNCIKDFGNFLKSKKNTFEKARGFILKLYKNKTDIIAYRFVVNLIDSLNKKLDKLSDIIEKIIEQVGAAESKLTDIISEKEKLFKNNSNDESYHKNNVKMLYENGAIEREFGIIIQDKNTFKNELIKFRRSVIANASDNTFSGLQKQLSVDLITKNYLYNLNSRIPVIYDELSTTGKIEQDNKLIGRNVLNYFHKEYKSTEDLETFLKNMRDETGVYAKLSSTKDDTLDTTGIKNYASDIYVIQYPAYNIDDDAEKFEASFVTLLNQVFQNPTIVKSTNGRTNELTIFKAKANMAVRSFEMVSGMMHDMYRNAFVKQTKMAELTIHTEGGPNDYPKIVPLNDSEKEKEWQQWFDKEILPYLLLAKSMGYIENSNGKIVLNLEPGNPVSTEIYKILDSSESLYDIRSYLFDHDIISEIDLEKRLYNKMRVNINKALSQKENKKQEQRQIWIENIKNSLLPSILENDYEGDKTNTEYHKFINAYEIVVSNILNI
ncbi:MAG TPA: tubulin-like doman-containing protein [Bacteroidales bacterium]|nr:tubulin-like doman-containing protein [Bacteroidales bacterium]